MRAKEVGRLAQYDPKKHRTKAGVFHIYGRLVVYALQHKMWLLTAFCTLCVASLLSFAIPQATRIVVDDIIPASAYDELLWLGAGVMVVAVLLGFFNFASTYAMSLAGQRTIYDIRNMLYQHLQRLSLSFFENRRTGDLMSRVTNDVNMLQQLITAGVVEIFKDIFVFIVVMAYLVAVDWQLGLMLLLTFPLMVVATQYFAARMRGAYRDVQVQTAHINDHLQDTLSNVKLIKSFAGEDSETDEFVRRSGKSLSANIAAVRFSATYAPIIEVLNYLGLAVIIVFGAWRTMEGALSVGELVAFLVYLRMLQQPIRRFTRVVNVIQQGAAAAERIFEIMDTDSDVKEKPGAIELPASAGRIELDRVSFAYHGREKVPVLDNITLELEPGTTVALVGPSGAGKSTIASLIVRFYDPQEGCIRFDGCDIRDVTLKSLRQHIGMVTQEIMLLNESVRDNIAYGKPDASDGEVELAAKMARADEFIEKLPLRYDSQVGERGVKLSGGQKQRLSIARALLKNPKLLILDEATSSLDTESEHLIQEALDIVMRERTCLVIAHRLSTIRKADRIVVIDEGRIAEQGTHDELLSRQGKYAQLYALSEWRGDP